MAERQSIPPLETGSTITNLVNYLRWYTVVVQEARKVIETRSTEADAEADLVLKLSILDGALDDLEAILLQEPTV